jgi:citrate synthase
MTNALLTPPPEFIEVPRGLNRVAVTTTTIGDVLGEQGFFHYRGHDAVELARHRSFEDVWCLIADGSLPSAERSEAFRRERATERELPTELWPIVDRAAAQPGSPLDKLRAVLSLAAAPLGLAPLVDTDPRRRAREAWRIAAFVPSIVAAISRLEQGLEPLVAPAELGHVAAYLYAATGAVPRPEDVRALEQYLILTIDHGFNASTFTARVVASTGADLAAVACSAIGALSGPLHGGAPSRALDALDAIGSPERAHDWVVAETAAGRRIMGFGHAVYRSVDPRSTLLREIALDLGGPLVERAVEIEREIETTLDELKPDRPLASNVEFYAGVVMAATGLPRALFTPTFAVSRVVGWMAHALEQADDAKLIRPAARYVGPPPQPARR